MICGRIGSPVMASRSVSLMTQYSYLSGNAPCYLSTLKAVGLEKLDEVIYRLVHEDLEGFAVYDLAGRYLRNVVGVDDMRIQVRFLNVEADEHDEGAIQHGVAAHSWHRASAGLVAHGR